jgi:hypothetical protein
VALPKPNQLPLRIEIIGAIAEEVTIPQAR